MEQQENKYGTVDGLQSHPAFMQLTAKQRQFVIRLIETGGDKKTACLEVYRPGPGMPLETQIARLMSNRNIRVLLNVYYGDAMPPMALTKTELAEIISARLRREPDMPLRDFMLLIRKYCFLRGEKWIDSTNQGIGRGLSHSTVDDPPKSQPKPLTIDDMVRQIEEGGTEDE